MKRRTFIQTTAAFGSAAAVGFPGIWSKRHQPWGASGDIPIGVMYSLTGTTAIVERSMNAAARMAIQEINDNGGVLNGRKLKPVVYDPASEPQQYSSQARKLILQDKAAAIFGCYTTASRKAVKPVVERRDNLLVWPTWYEGSECSKNILYAGAAVPNQQLYNSIPWVINELGRKKMFIVGSDYAFPRGMAKVTKQLLKEHGGEWVADEYLPLGHSEWAQMVSKIKASGADVVFSNVVGDSIVAFYREFLNQGLTYDEIPIIASTTTEIEIAAMAPEYANGSYASFPYFMSIDTDTNRQFVENYKEFVKDPDAVTQAANEAVYQGVYFWKKAVENAGNPEPDAVVESFESDPPRFDAPQGDTKIDPKNLHTHLYPRIGQWQANGMAKIIDEYKDPLAPLPYASSGETVDNRMCSREGLTEL